MDDYCKDPMEYAHKLCGQNAAMLLFNLAIYILKSNCQL
jgi:hypothetical protein